MFFKRSGNGLKREKDTAVSSCIHATTACTWALLLSKQNNEKTLTSLRRGLQYLLNRNLFKSSWGDPIIPKNSWNTDFRLLGYPIFSQYDILHGLVLMAEAGYLNDEHTGEAFNIIMSKQNSDGTWNLETAQTGMLFGDMKKPPLGKKNPWITLKVLRMLAKTD